MMRARSTQPMLRPMPWPKGAVIWVNPAEVEYIQANDSQTTKIQFRSGETLCVGVTPREVAQALNGWVP
jgi:competence transcription factor ComK